MRHVIGFALFWVGVGILITFLIPKEGWFVRSLVAIVFLLAGYHLFAKCS